MKLNMDGTMMEFVRERPPNYDAIVAAFPGVKARNTVFFCYGNIIYGPMSVSPPLDIWYHEAVHSRQQGDDPEGWWEQYSSDLAFRFRQELPAFKAQYRFIKENYGRKQSRRYLGILGNQLSGPLYGNLCSASEARMLISDAS